MPEAGRSDVRMRPDPRRRGPVRGCWLAVTVCAAALATGPAMAADPPGAKLPDGPPHFRSADDVALYVPFDGEHDAATKARGGVKLTHKTVAAPEGKTPPAESFFPGAWGQAALIGAGKPSPIYTFSKSLPGDQGSVEFWFCPRDWDNSRKHGWHDVMEVAPVIHLAAEPAGGKGLAGFLIFSILQKAMRDRPLPVPLKPGQWHHVVATWSPPPPEAHYRTADESLKVYLDGRELDRSWTRQGYTFGSTFTFNRDEKGAGGRLKAIRVEPAFAANPKFYKGQLTLLDELRVYSRALTREEAANAHARYRPDAALTPLPPTHVDVRMNTPLGRVDLTVYALRIPAARTVEMKLTGPEGKILAAGALPPLANGRTFRRFEPVSVEFGKTYQLALTYLDEAGKPVHAQTIECTRPPKPPWMGSQAGVHEGKALPGFPPVKLDGATVKVWGREIRLNHAALPEAIISQGENMLAAPLRVSLKAGGKPVPLAPAESPPTVARADDEWAVLTGEMSGGGWTVRTRTAAQFDGMMKLEMTFAPEPGSSAEIDELAIDIPVNAVNALFHAFWTGRGFGFRHGTEYARTRSDDGEVFNSATHDYLRNPDLQGSFVPYFAFHDDDRGLAWFAESDRGWTVGDKVPAVLVTRKAGVVNLRLNVIHRTRRIDKPLTIVFGLQAAPMRPWVKNHRSLGKTLQMKSIDSFSPPPVRTDVFRADKNAMLPQDGDWAAAARRMRQRDKRLGRDGKDPLYKGTMLYLSRQWPGLPPDAVEFSPIWYKSGFIRHTPAAMDCEIWHWSQWLRSTPLRGFYIDDIWIPQSIDPRTGLAYELPDGKVQPGFAFFDYNQYLKRLRWIFHDNGREPLIMVHNTQTLFPPHMSFVDYFFDGEWLLPRYGEPVGFFDKGRLDRRGVDNRADFIERWGVDRIRVDNFRKWGPAPLFMGAKFAGRPAQREPYVHWMYYQHRSYYACMLLCDVAQHIGYPPKSLADSLAWYTDEAEFVPFWDPKAPVRCPDKNVAASVYRLPGRAVIVVVNDRKERRTVSVEIDPAGLGLGDVPPDRLVVADIDQHYPPAEPDAKSGMVIPRIPREIQRAGTRLTFEIRGDDYRMILVRK